MSDLPRTFSPDQWNDIADRAARLYLGELRERYEATNAELDRLELMPVKEAAQRIGKSDEHVRRHFTIHPRGGVRRVDVVAYLKEEKKPEPAHA